MNDATATALYIALERPTTRGDCLPGGCNEQRPCPWVTCKWHLWPTLGRKGDAEVRLPVLPDIDALPPIRRNNSCALDVADRVHRTGSMTYTLLGEILGVSRQRATEIYECAMHKVRERAGLFFPDQPLRSHEDGDTDTLPLSEIDYDGGE